MNATDVQRWVNRIAGNGPDAIAALTELADSHDLLLRLEEATDQRFFRMAKAAEAPLDKDGDQ